MLPYSYVSYLVKTCFSEAFRNTKWRVDLALFVEESEIIEALLRSHSSHSALVKYGGLKLTSRNDVLLLRYVLFPRNVRQSGISVISFLNI